MKTEPIIIMIGQEYKIFCDRTRNYLSYRGVENINDLRCIFKMYCNIYSGHRKKATEIYNSMKNSLHYHLPLKIFQYFNGYDELATYSEWKQKGFQVMKGQKHVFKKVLNESHDNFTLGECLFSKKQTTEIKYRQPSFAT